MSRRNLLPRWYIVFAQSDFKPVILFAFSIISLMWTLKKSFETTVKNNISEIVDFF